MPLFSKLNLKPARPVVAREIVETRALYAAPERAPGYVAKVWAGDHLPALTDGALRLVYVERILETRLSRVWWRQDNPMYATRVRRGVDVAYEALPYGHEPNDIKSLFGEV